MPRQATPTSGPVKPLVAAVVILLLLSLTPSKWTGWLTQVSSLATFVVSPISGPISAIARWLGPAGPRQTDNSALAAVEQELERFKTLYLQEQARTAELRRQIAEFQGGLMVSDVHVRQVRAPVIGTSADPAAGLLKVRAGRRHGVEVNSVATVNGTQLLGRVESVDDRTCWVRIITTPRLIRPIRGVICIGDDTSAWLTCSLSPMPQGRLQGPFEYRSRVAEELQVGQEVRLSPDSGDWPKSAAMLLVGTVTEISPVKDNPLTRLVTVKPTVDRLDMVSEVVLRIPMDEEAVEPSQPDAGGPR